MRQFFTSLFWTMVFLLLLAGIDQLLVRVPLTAPAPLAAATFYRDLRSRVVDLVGGAMSAPRQAPPPAPQATHPAKAKSANPRAPANGETLIEQRRDKSAVATGPAPAAASLPARPVVKEPAPRYVFADDQGTIHFAETLAEIPEPYRGKARPLGE